jgi:hypothetical protein
MLGDAGQYKVIRYVAHCDEFTIAIVEDKGKSQWAGELVAATWNIGRSGKPFPQSRGRQMWFILPEPIARLVLASEALKTLSFASDHDL